MDKLTEILNKGYYASLGALALAIENLQDEQKRVQTVRTVQTNLESFWEELTNKGVATETEARSYVDRMVSNQVKTVDTTATATDPAPETVRDDMAQLQDLTRQIADLRAELERMGQ